VSLRLPRILPPLLCLFLLSCGGRPAPPRAFTGAAACAECHGGPDGGQVQESWQGTAHARAWTDLAGVRGAEVAREMGLAGDPQIAAQCLECHSTGHGVPASLKAALPIAEGVSCEACHGAGADYIKKLVMPDPRQARSAGLNPEPRRACQGCHREGVAHIRPFKYEERWPVIAHRLPPRKK
jgi:hypothetical protein